MELFKDILKELSFKDLTEVQKIVIPKILGGKSLVVSSVTGSGKTHAFLLPIIEKINEENKDMQVLISAPTRELAKQIFDFAKEVIRISKKDIDMRLYVGGTDRDKELERLKKSNPMIAIGTPGKLYDLAVKERALNIYKVKQFVIDEADMALDMGFIEEMDKTASLLPDDVQMMVFSATIHEKLNTFLKKYLNNPEFVDLTDETLGSLNIAHQFIKTKSLSKIEVLENILKVINPYLCIIFCNTKTEAEEVAKALETDHYKVGLLHGGLESRERSKVIKRIKNLEFTYVVSSDISARGMDFEQASHIINYSLPKDIEFYIHRTGRTGRMHNTGVAISLYDYNDDEYLNKLEEKGLKTSYVDIKNGEIKEVKARLSREKREFTDKNDTEKAKKMIKPIAKTVKPGYKKKYNTALEKAKKKIKRERIWKKH